MKTTELRALKVYRVQYPFTSSTLNTSSDFFSFFFFFFFENLLLGDVNEDRPLRCLLYVVVLLLYVHGKQL